MNFSFGTDEHVLGVVREKMRGVFKQLQQNNFTLGQMFEKLCKKLFDIS